MRIKEKVFIERACPATINGIRAICGTEEEYNWYLKGLSDGRKDKEQKLQEQAKEIKKWIDFQISLHYEGRHNAISDEKLWNKFWEKYGGKGK